MIEAFVKRIMSENEKLQNELEKINSNNSIYESLSKIRNNIAITKEASDSLLEFVKKDNSINSLDKETVEFILLILLPNGKKLESNQKKTLDNLIKKYPQMKSNDLMEKINRNKKLIESIQSEELFIYFDDLNLIFKEYEFSFKEQLKIIKELIQKNYSYEFKEEQKIIDDSVTDSIVSTEDDFKSEQNNEDSSDIKVEEHITLDKDIIDFFKKHKLFYDKLDDESKSKILQYGLNIEKANIVLEFLKMHKFNIKTLYNKDTETFIKLILFSKIEYINELIEQTITRNINLKTLINNQVEVLYSEKDDGAFENFMANLNFLDELKYDYSKNNEIILYMIYNKYLETSYYLYTQVYNLELKDVQKINVLGTKVWCSTLDRFLETGDQIKDMFENVGIDILTNIYTSLACGLKLFFNSRGIVKESYRVKLAEIMTTGKYKKNVESFKSFKDEKTQLDIDLNSLFDSVETPGEEPLYIIPHDTIIDEEVLNNEYISYLEQTYKHEKYLYVINGTRVSRIKVLRIISYLKTKGVEITEDVVKYALKFNYVFIKNDLQNINDVFNQKKYVGK